MFTQFVSSPVFLKVLNGNFLSDDDPDYDHIDENYVDENKIVEVCNVCLKIKSCPKRYKQAICSCVSVDFQILLWD